MAFIGNERNFSSDKSLFFKPEFFTKAPHFTSKKTVDNEELNKTKDLIRSVTKTTEFQTFATKCLDSDEPEIEKCDLANFINTAQGKDFLIR